MNVSRIAKSLVANKFLVVAIFAVFSIAGFVGVQAATNSSSTKSNASISSESSNCAVDVCVALTETGALPSTITVIVGQTVQFNSADGKSHNLTTEKEEAGSLHEDHGSGIVFTSGEFGADEAWRVQFKDKGTYDFRDTENSDISILVVAYEPGAELSIE